MCCPKSYSTVGGMGCELLKKVELSCDIVKTLKRNLPNHSVTCKMRLKPSVQESIDFLKALEMSGVDAVTVECRKREERPKDPPRYDHLKLICESNHSVPIIGNGDVFRYSDIQKMKDETGVDSVMIARGALNNASVFRKDGFLPVYDVIQSYLSLSAKLGNGWNNAKYVIGRMEGELSHQFLTSFQKNSKSELSLMNYYQLDMEGNINKNLVTTRSSLEEPLAKYLQITYNNKEIKNKSNSNTNNINNNTNIENIIQNDVNFGKSEPVQKIQKFDLDN
eukprot:TRINITY_DN4292_c0_g1_i2.p1 TRINITY_DN4292_c0_g1~~TRINITY_DN4292_c0_g1_i2.p1  ORF type:complete len:279 (-),score=65.32 TRINITY_DN4292_c0_g1_i2:53-889(-)